MVPRLWSLQEHLLQRIRRRPALEGIVASLGLIITPSGLVRHIRVWNSVSAWRLGETRPILNLMSSKETLLAFSLWFQNSIWAGER